MDSVDVLTDALLPHLFWSLCEVKRFISCQVQVLAIVVTKILRRWSPAEWLWKNRSDSHRLSDHVSLMIFFCRCIRLLAGTLEASPGICGWSFFADIFTSLLLGFLHWFKQDCLRVFIVCDSARMEHSTVVSKALVQLITIGEPFWHLLLYISILYFTSFCANFRGFLLGFFISSGCSSLPSFLICCFSRVNHDQNTGRRGLWLFSRVLQGGRRAILAWSALGINLHCSRASFLMSIHALFFCCTLIAHKGKIIDVYDLSL